MRAVSIKDMPDIIIIQNMPVMREVYPVLPLHFICQYVGNVPDFQVGSYLAAEERTARIALHRDKGAMFAIIYHLSLRPALGGSTLFGLAGYRLSGK